MNSTDNPRIARFLQRVERDHGSLVLDFCKADLQAVGEGFEPQLSAILKRALQRVTPDSGDLAHKFGATRCNS